MPTLALLFGAIAITGLAAIAAIVAWGVWIVVRAFVDLVREGCRPWSPNSDWEADWPEESDEFLARLCADARDWTAAHSQPRHGDWPTVPRCCAPDLDAFQQGPVDMVGR